jgi:hypothetical protein
MLGFHDVFKVVDKIVLSSKNQILISTQKFGPLKQRFETYCKNVAYMAW